MLFVMFHSWVMLGTAAGLGAADVGIFGFVILYFPLGGGSTAIRSGAGTVTCGCCGRGTTVSFTKTPGFSSIGTPGMSSTSGVTAGTFGGAPVVAVEGVGFGRRVNTPGS